ncbi:hypothetical protein BV511_03160 [Methylorubrum extorquens]|uniref:DUF3168 domain-containing protein n=1 Tax=Methylorubrum extorquens TaxID=408 RepID=UPI000972CA1F|nr:DUF3168 domain-containing protein [Methylorubrum extorquens]APX83813.1 hypothetical protein BV511_03160 [Methylorubrum extorquens]
MSAELALQGALYDALRAVPALMAPPLSGRILDRVEEDESRPYLHLRSFQAIDDGADCVDGIEIFADLDVWSEGVGKPEASRLAGIVRDALHGQDLSLAAPWALVDVAHRDTTIDDSGGRIVRARMTFRALVERVP